MRKTGALIVGLVLIALVAVCTHVITNRPRRHAPQQFTLMIDAAARRYDVDPALIMAVIRQESRFDPTARGAAGEVGLMQITRGAVSDWARIKKRQMPSRSAWFDPALNIEIGTWYLARAQRRWRGHKKASVLVLVQYNAGPERARKWADAIAEKNIAESIPIESTRNYVINVTRFQSEYREWRQQRDSPR